MIHVTLRLLACAAIALPLGQGLCCCVLGGLAAREATVAAAPVAAAETSGSCCAAERSAPREHCPEAPAADCDCPDRDAALLAAAPAVPPAAPAFPAWDLAPVPQPVATGTALPVASFAPEPPNPVPKTPLYRTHCALLC